MIRRTFQLLTGLGPWRERDLWARGISTWDQFPKAESGVVVSRKLDDQIRDRIGACQLALDGCDLAALSRLIPAREHWRLYNEFAEEAAFFDVETEGTLSPTPTVASVFDREGLHVFIRDHNLDRLPEAMARSRLWVSFNGSCFDVPALSSHFENFPKPSVHLDLRFLCRRFGKGGGLKGLEDRLGFGRPPHLRGVNGWDAIILWRAYQRNADVEALRFLVEYNLYDSFQLRALLDRVYNHAIDLLALDAPRRRVFDRGEILYDVSKLLLQLGTSPGDLSVLERLKREKERNLLEVY